MCIFVLEYNIFTFAKSFFHRPKCRHIDNDLRCHKQMPQHSMPVCFTFHYLYTAFVYPFNALLSFRLVKCVNLNMLYNHAYILAGVSLK